MAAGNPFKTLTPKKKFLLTLVVIYALSVPIISLGTYVILRDNAIREAYSTGKLYLSAMEAIRHYVSAELRPTLYRDAPGRFILEGMSRSYVANTIGRDIHGKYPGYRYKNATIRTPMNPENAADDFETSVIGKFIDGKLTEWQGVKSAPDGMYYVLARSGEPFSAECLHCHGNPSDAPLEIRTRYGLSGGFNRHVGDLLDGKFVYIPIELPLAAAEKGVTVFIAIYTLFFGVIFVVINVRFTGLYDDIEASRRKVEAVNADLTHLNEELEALTVERTMSLIALTVADKVRNPASVIGLTCRRIVQKQEVPDNVRRDLEGVMEECDGLEKIVKEFGALTKGRRTHFKYEDINAVVRSVLAVIEKEAAEKGVKVSAELSSEPLGMNIQTSLLRAALFHLVRNALEATPSGSVVKVQTKAEGGKVVFVISDAGQGIRSEDLERIFEPFYTTKPYRYGVGLPLVKQIVSEHLGEIRVESEPGRGTTFIVLFPARWKETTDLGMFREGSLVLSSENSPDPHNSQIKPP